MPMPKLPHLAALGACALLYGCGTPMPIQGETRADNRTQGKIASNLINISRRVRDCPTVDALEAQVRQVNEPKPGDPDEVQRLGSVSDIWTASLCGKKMRYQVIHAPDGRGGTFLMFGALD